MTFPKCSLHLFLIVLWNTSYVLQQFPIWWHAYRFHSRWKEGSFWCAFPPGEFTVYRKCGAAFLSAPSQWEAVQCCSGFSSVSPVKSCRTLKLNIVENTAATLKYQFPFLSPKKDVSCSAALTRDQKRMMKYIQLSNGSRTHHFLY